MQDHHQQTLKPTFLGNSLNCLAGAFMVLVTLPSLAHALDMTETADRFQVKSGTYQWAISKSAFTVIDQASHQGIAKFEGGDARVDFLGSTSTFGPPSEFLTGNNWIELRGWADRSKQLWYVARYRFFENEPFAHLALSLMDRHDDYATDGPWDDYWTDRDLSNYQVSLRTATDLEGRYFTQLSSFTGREVGVDPDIILYANEGSPYQWRPDLAVDDLELIHDVTEDPSRSVGRTNSITWIPGYTGRANLTALLTPGQRYRSAEDVVYEIQHTRGVERLLLDQNSGEVEIGSFELDRNSAVSVFTESTSVQHGVVRARALRVEPLDREPL